MPTLREELTTIHALLIGSPLYAHPEVQVVTQEYTRGQNAIRLINRERRTALLILFFGRAIDSLLGFAVQRISHTMMIPVPVHTDTIGSKITFCRNNGLFVNPLTVDDLHLLVRERRNHYLHQAGEFPSESELEMFLLASAIGIQEIISGLS